MEINNYSISGTLVHLNDTYEYISETIPEISDWRAIRYLEKKYKGVLRDIKIKKLD